jgi:hypothetical protein
MPFGEPPTACMAVSSTAADVPEASIPAADAGVGCVQAVCN